MGYTSLKLRAGEFLPDYGVKPLYAVSNHRFNSGNNLAAVNFRPEASNYADFIELMKEYLIPLMSNIKSSGVTNKPLCSAIFDTLSGFSAVDYSDVIVSFYEGTLFDLLALGDMAHFAMQPTSKPTPWNASGYLKNASTILAA